MVSSLRLAQGWGRFLEWSRVQVRLFTRYGGAGMNHTKTPWEFVPARKEGRSSCGSFIRAPKEGNMPYALEVAGEDYTGYGDEERRAADLQFIVAAVNSHDRLLAERAELVAAAIARLSERVKLLEALDNCAASLETCLAHFGKNMTSADRRGRKQTLAAARAVLSGSSAEVQS